MQVQNKDVSKAIELLTELGYIKNNEPQPLDLLTRVDKKTSSIPFIKNLKVTTRIIVITFVSVFLILLVSYLIIKPSRLDLLTNEAWFVDKVYYKNKLVGPKTIESFKSIGKGDADFSGLGELAEFSKSSNQKVTGLQEIRDVNHLMLPGLHSKIINGTWKLNGDIIVLQVDTLNYILDGAYNIEISDKNLILKSATTTIIAHQGL